MATLFELCFASFKQEVRDYLDRFDTLSKKLSAINRKKKTSFSNWEVKHLNYLYAVYKNKLNIRRRQNRSRILKSLLKTKDSLNEYRREHPYGEVEGWIPYPISQLTGMQAYDEESWNEFDFEEDSCWPDYKYRKWSFRNELDEFDVGNVPILCVPEALKKQVARDWNLLNMLHIRLRDLRTMRSKRQGVLFTHTCTLLNQKPFKQLDPAMYDTGNRVDEIIYNQFKYVNDPEVLKLNAALEEDPLILPEHNEWMILMEEREIEFERQLELRDNIVYPEMMEAERTDNLETNKQGNVVLSEENPSEPATGVLQEQNCQMWNRMSSNERDSLFSELTGRWTLWDNTIWKTDHKRNDLLESYSLPHDFIATAGIAAGTMPLFLPFKIFKYVRTDMEIKIHINSNKFQTGQLQCSWQYMEHYDRHGSMNTIYSRSQLPHVIVNAGSSNEATLYIPYKYINPYVCTQSKKTGLSCLDLGDLELRVLTELQTVDTGPTTASITLFIRFPNPPLLHSSFQHQL